MKVILSLFSLFFLYSCSGGSDVLLDEEEKNPLPSTVDHPEWSDNSAIYEVNIRQFSPEGTFNAFAEHLPRLRELGVEILWIMPVQPIGVKNRKGGLGSYYSISDYTAVNPEFGSMEDFRNMVETAHNLEMKVILDWVGNHTAWDHPWMEEHPDWYTRNSEGEVIPPVEDWSDVADLNYEAPGLKKAMLNAMKFWVNETDIDGYRCDVAMMVPMDFWNTARRSLDSIKPVFMLAEAEGPEFHQTAFDMTYGWEFHHLMNQVSKGVENTSVFDSYLKKMDSTYPSGAYRMYFTTNHDENSWNGTVFERLGDNHLNFFVLASTFPYGMPLVYSGQEAGLSRRLSFFEKDSIDWSNDEYTSFYHHMIELKKTHPALRNGKEQGSFERIMGGGENVYSFKRKADGETLLVFLNFNKTEVQIPLGELAEDPGIEYLAHGFHAMENQQLLLGANAMVIMKKD